MSLLSTFSALSLDMALAHIIIILVQARVGYFEFSVFLNENHRIKNVSLKTLKPYQMLNV